MRAIDGDALYKKLNDIRKEEILLHGRLNNKGCCTLSTALFEIGCAPTIGPERKKGKWSIKNGELAIWDVCSECRKMVMHKAPFYNFCPNCGADMREEN